jgi:uncharacterized protein (TIGR02118 family)
MGESRVYHTLFIVYRESAGELSGADLAKAASVAARLHGLAGGLAFTPTSVEGEHPFVGDGRGPPLALQLDFDTADALTAALSADGPLAEIVRPGAIASLPGATVGHQRMIGRRFSAPDPVSMMTPGAKPCTFLVEYPGATADLEAWLDHYDAHHPPIMARFPGIREVATFRPAQRGPSALPCGRETAMQRNKVVFDSAAALLAALASPVMEEMRADAAMFPPSTRRASHHAMATHRLV